MPIRASLALAAFALLASTTVASAAGGDPAKGRDTYFQCAACHSIDANRVGPMHRGLFGRQAGTVAGFSYSGAMKAAGEKGLVWNEETLDRYIAGPAKVVPGNKMLFGGIADAETRADLIAYLKEATAPKAN